MESLPALEEIRRMTRAELDELVDRQVRWFGESEALAVLQNRFCGPRSCSAIARTPRLSGYYSVRLAIVGHPSTPQTHSLRLVHHLYWPDMVRLSIDVHVPPSVRRALDVHLANRASKLALGEKISAARRCSRDLAKLLLTDPSARVFEALLVNPRLREDDLVALISSERVSAEKLTMVGNNRKWCSRYPVRRALVLNSSTPRSVAASQLRYLRRQDLVELSDGDEISTYLKRCIERLLSVPKADPGGAGFADAGTVD